MAAAALSHAERSVDIILCREGRALIPEKAHGPPGARRPEWAGALPPHLRRSIDGDLLNASELQRQCIFDFRFLKTDDAGRAFHYLGPMSEAAIRARPDICRVLCIGLALAAALALPAPARAGEDVPQHGIAMLGAPALAPDFVHLPYANPDAPKGGRLTIGVMGTFDSLNSFNIKGNSASQGLEGYVYQRLMMRNVDEPFTLYGLVAQTIETNADRSRVVFHLDPRARFSDKSPITSDDIHFTFDLLREKGRPQFRSPYSQVKAVETPDPLTIAFDLTGAGDRELPLILALMPVLSKAHTDPGRFVDATLEPPVASGPYRVALVEPGQRLTLRRNPDYWAKDLPISRGLYNFDEIRVEYYRDANALFEAFKSGGLDYREETDTARWLNAYDFPAIANGRIVKAALPIGGPKGMLGLAFNTRRAVFADVRVREALSDMFDFEWLNANLFGGLYRRTQSFFADSVLASTGKPADERERTLLARWPGAIRNDILEGTWAPPVSDGSGRDRDIARRAIDLLQQAGYVVQKGVMKKAAGGAPLAFEILVADPALERVIEIYSESLRRIGVAVSIRRVDEVQYQRRRERFDFDMMPGQWLASASPGNEQLTRWSSASAAQDGSYNLAGVRSPAVDGLIGDLLASSAPADFAAAARALDRALLSGFYIVPLFHAPDQWFAYSSKLAFPERYPRFARPLFGFALDTWWRKQP